MAQTLPKSAPGFFPALLLTAILMAFLAAAAAPTPLYALYRESWQFSPALLTLAFSIYAGGLMLALLVFGSLSDHLGRRPLIRAALIIELLAMSVFLYANSVELLIAARLLQGFATGIATAVLGAAMLDIDRERGPLINSVAPMLGMALGALGSSALVQFGGDPLHRVYVWLLAVFALALVLLRWLPESVSRQPGALASLKPRIRIPPQARRAFWSVAPLNASLWALGGFYLSLGPTLARQVTGLPVPMIGGGLVSLLCFCGAVAIFALRNRPAAVILRRGGLALIIGLLITLLGVDSSNLWLFFLGTAVAGLGFGGAFLGALRSVVPLAHAHERGALMAGFYVLSYLAFSVPAILAGLAIQRYGLVATTNGYAGLQILAASLVLLLSLRAPAAQKAPA